MDKNGLINGLRPPADDELARTMTHAPETPEMLFDKKLTKYVGNRMMAPVNAIMGLKDLTDRAMHGEQVSANPSAGFQALRGMSWLSGLAPGAPGGGATLHVILGPRKTAFYDEDSFMHSLLNPKTGDKVGYINMQRQPDDSLRIGMVQGSKGGPWQEGFSGTKELLKSIKETYPWATGIGGYRISGARAKAGATGEAKMSFGEKRFDPEALAKYNAQVEGDRAANEQYWAQATENRAANQRSFEENPNLPGVSAPFDQNAAARRAAFEDRHALAAQTPEPYNPAAMDEALRNPDLTWSTPASPRTGEAGRKSDR